MDHIITSPANPQVKRVQAYQKKRKERDRDGVFVAEGERLVTEAPSDCIAELYLSASYHAAMPPAAERFFVRHKEQAQVVSDEVFAKMSDTKTPQGILAVVRKNAAVSLPVPEAGDGKRNSTGPLLVLENIQDPGNLGTILRTSEAAGACGIVLCGNMADVYQPKVVRSTMGSIFRVPVLQAETLYGHAPETPPEEEIIPLARHLRTSGYRIVCADMGGDTDYDAFDWKQPVALVIGNEANGLSDAAKKEADVLLRIPMAGKNESLNAAVATAVLLFEAARQLRVRTL